MDRIIAALFLLCPALGWAEGPALARLRCAAGAPESTLTLEGQSVRAGAAFLGESSSAPTAEAVAPRPSAALAPVPANRGPLRPAAPTVPPLPERVRAAGLAAGAAGLGLLAYAVAASTAGPVLAAAALLFFGGMAAYLAHRRLKGKDDF